MGIPSDIMELCHEEFGTTQYAVRAAKLILKDRDLRHSDEWPAQPGDLQEAYSLGFKDGREATESRSAKGRLTNNAGLASFGDLEAEGRS